MSRSHVLPSGTHLTVDGAGPLVLTSPGMGDLADVFRDVAEPLRDAGYRVACLELRGHGRSTPTSGPHGLEATADDLAAAIELLGEPAVVLGASCSAGSAVLLAAHRPELVRGLVLLGPHLGPAATGLQRLLARVQVAALRRPWGAALWASYYRSLHPGRRAPWFDEHVAAVRGALQDPARMRAFGSLARALVRTHVDLPLDRVTAPTLVVHGALDPEVQEPAADLDRAVTALSATDAEGLLVPEAGHYPHSQRPDVVVPAVLGLLGRLPRGVETPGA